MEEKSTNILNDVNYINLIYNNLQDGIILLNKEGKFLSANHSFSKISGFSADELKDISSELIFTNSDNQPFKIKPLLENGKKVFEFPALVKNKDNKTIGVFISGSKITDDQTGEQFLLASIKNDYLNDEIKHLKNELELLQNEKEQVEEKVKEAERASEAKSLFLASMSHEIRTPMNGVLGYLELLEQEVYESKEELNSFISKTRSAAESLLDIINNILDISKIEAGRMELEEIDFSMREVLENAVCIVSPLAEEKGLEVLSKVDEKIPWVLIGDPFRIRQIFTNLISNAIKYTVKGQINIEVTLDRVEDGTAVISTFVKDTGVGIPKDKIEMLFKPYSQLDKSYNKVYRGTGLGLRLCKEFINLMGGTIGVESEEKVGSNFFFTIKLKELEIRQK